jgi:hypothetical protein
MKVRTDVTQEDYELIRDMTRAGHTYYEVASKVPHLRRHDIRALYSGFRMGVHRIANLTAEQLAEARKEVQAKWSAEDWSRRWVGRYGMNQDTSLQQAASRLMPY